MQIHKAQDQHHHHLVFFFKSFGPASISGTTYDIDFEGVNGLFTPTSLDGVGGLLTIVIKSTANTQNVQLMSIM